MQESPKIHESFDVLKAKQRAEREAFSDAFGLRIHRALSWLDRAEKETEDPDASFIFYWISLNAAFAEYQTSSQNIGTRTYLNEYFQRLLELDKNHAIYETVWNTFSKSIRMLLQNKYVFSPFWDHYNGVPDSESWEERFTKSKKTIHRALQRKDTGLILSILFDRLYVLRNQLIHGGATWKSQVNREQVNDGAKIMASLLPIFLHLMMDNPAAAWGKPYYPVVDQ